MLHRVIIRRNSCCPEVGQGQLDLAHPRQHRWSGVDGRARKSLIIIRVSGVPERLTTRQPETVEGSCRGKGLSLLHCEPGPAYDIVDIGKPLLAALGNNPLGQLATDALHLGEAKPDREVAISAVLASAIRSRPYEGSNLELHPLQATVRACWAAAPSFDRFEVGIDLGLHDVGTQHCYAVPTRISDQRLRRVEAHRLGSEQAGQKRSWVVQLQP